MPPDSTRLRALGIQDLDTAIGYVRQYYGHEGIEFSSTVERGIKILLGAPEHGRFFEILRDDFPAGYIVMTFGFDHEVGGPLAIITDFYLSEEARGRGIGTGTLALITAEARALGLAAIELLVLHHNPRGRAFYERNGFSSLGERTPMVRLL